MTKEEIVQNNGYAQASIDSVSTVPAIDAHRLIHQLREYGWLPEDFRSPASWPSMREIPSEELGATIKKWLLTTGWHEILRTTRFHNSQRADSPWDPARTTDFLAALELSLSRRETRELGKIPIITLDEPPESLRMIRLTKSAEEREQKARTVVQRLIRLVGTEGWFLSPRALRTRLGALGRRAHAQAQIENSFSRAALYAARMEGARVEQDIALAQVDKLRHQLHSQLQIYCQEQGIPLPQPYSKEEAYCLHLLAAYFVSLAEAQHLIARQGAALARRQVSLEGQRAQAAIDREALPHLLGMLREIYPVREGYRWEQLRHNSSLAVGSVVAVIAGGLWGVFESLSDTLVVALIRYAPILAPAMFVALGTLTAQTILQGIPLTFGTLLAYVGRALWNGGIALGAALVAYGCWRYFIARQHKSDAMRTAAREVLQGGPNNDTGTAHNMA